MNDTIMYVRITNNCPEKVRIYFRYVMYTKPSFREKRKKFITVLPSHTTYPIAKANLIGARNWEEISSRPCISIATIDHAAQFYHIKNLGVTPIQIPIKLKIPKDMSEKYPKRKMVVVIKPGAISRAIDKQSLQMLGQLQEFIRTKKVSVRPADIGPGREGTFGSFYGEDVYICYECGGPIVFRGQPPVPVHI